jgi:hypothetical protein
MSAYTTSKPFCEAGVTFDETKEGKHHKSLHDEVFELKKKIQVLQKELEDLKMKAT